MRNFWQDLPQPFLAMAPMDDVTDVVFREIIADLARPDVFFTEFTSSDGIVFGSKHAMSKLKYTSKQRPIVAQIWGNNPQTIFKAAQIIQELKFDGLDLNMGCPVSAVTKRGSGAALIKNQPLTHEIIIAARTGAPNLPLSIKTRLGFSKIDTDNWIDFILKEGLEALTIHGRIATQKSLGEANWSEIGKIVDLKNKISPRTIIIGNGDVKSRRQAKVFTQKYKVNGTMLGRAVFDNPKVFAKIPPFKLTQIEKIALAKTHLNLFVKTWGTSKNFEIIKKYFKMYINGFRFATNYRNKLMKCKTVEETSKILEELSVVCVGVEPTTFAM